MTNEMQIALTVVAATPIYFAIGLLTTMFFNAIRHRINPSGYRDDDTLKFLFFLWPAAIPIFLALNIWPLVEHALDKQDRNFRAKLNDVPTYEELQKKVVKLEKELADAILVKESNSGMES
jgi:hypothetical protein